VGIQDQELALAELPGIVEAHDAVGILTASVHHWAPYFFEVLPEHLAMLDDVLAVSDVEDAAVVVGHLLDHPGHLSGSDPLPGIFEPLVASQVDEVDDLLYFREGGHCGHLAVALKVEPGEQGLQRPVGATPAVVVEGLV
jgi:hypothetical protein